jgi:hypothetical protein
MFTLSFKTKYCITNKEYAFANTTLVYIPNKKAMLAIDRLSENYSKTKL